MFTSKTTHGCLWQLYSQLPNWRQSRCPSVDVCKQTVVLSDDGVLFITKETCTIKPLKDMEETYVILLPEVNQSEKLFTV